VSTEHPHSHPVAKHSGATKSEIAAMENFVRLQKSQAEYLAWLEACEKKPEVDRYIYRKIR
jgi:hypothetical protein